MKKYPNASILSIITQTDKNAEKVLFLYLKPIPDYYPSNSIYWYDNAGKNGIARNIWEALSIKQWVVCGKDVQIDQLFTNLLTSKQVIIDGKQIDLVLPPHTNSSFTEDPFNGQDAKFDALTTPTNTLIPQEFYQEENLKFLSGYSTGSSEIKPLYPLGFFGENFIKNNLEKNIWGIREHRAAYLSFHGVRETSKKGIGSREMVGFYQQNFDVNSDYTAVVKNENGIEIGNQKVDKKTGFFKIPLSEPTQKGKVEILVNTKEEKAIEYVLLQDIDIKVEGHLANSTFTDVYGRSFMNTSEKKKRPEKILNYTWQQGVYVNTKAANEKLSDLFKANFDYLGPKVLIADPYFIGNIKSDKATAALDPSHCQTAFMNALIHSAIEKGISQLSILGYWARAKNHIENDWVNKYEKIFKNLISVNKLEKYFPASTIKFYNAEEDFHSRYWFSIVEDNGTEILDKCILITNSLGYMTEVDIIPISDEAQLKQIIRKYSQIFRNSENRLTI
jgi:hypothetical protein